MQQLLYKNYQSLFILLTVFLLYGCAKHTATTSSVPKPNSTIINTLPEKKGITVPHNSKRYVNDMLEAYVEVVNFSKNNYTDIEYRFRWYDRHKYEVGKGPSIWKPLFLEAADSKKVTGLAPTPKAESFRFYIREKE